MPRIGVIPIATARVYSVIDSFRSKALRELWEDDKRRGLRPDLVERVLDRLTLLHNAAELGDVNVVGARLHGLRGKPRRYAVWVNKNWRVTFGWEDGYAIDVDLEDYH
jgi:proteic killer suppression protein